MHDKKLGLIIALPIAFLAADASARPFRVNQIPAAPDNCNTCHTNGGGSPRNDFGMQSAMALDGQPVSGAAVDWSILCPMDADGDGASNGEELGDPGCSWVIGDAPTTAVSDPNDSADFPMMGMPDAGVSMDMGSGGGDEDPIDDEGGCSTTGVNNHGSISLLLCGFLAMLSGRRRRSGR